MVLPAPGCEDTNAVAPDPHTEVTPLTVGVFGVGFIVNAIDLFVSQPVNGFTTFKVTFLLP